MAKGYTQKKRVNFKKVFSPLVRHASIRLFLALIVVQDFELDQLDVKTIFLHKRLEEEIFMAQSEGYKDLEKPKHVCVLKKSFNGLKQSSRQWYLKFDEFIRCNCDCCVYYKLLRVNLYINLLLYVENMLIAYKEKSDIENLTLVLNSEFDLKNLRTVRKILGVEIERIRIKGLIYLS